MKTDRRYSFIVAGVCLVLVCSTSEMDAVAAFDAPSVRPVDSLAEAADANAPAETKRLMPGHDPVGYVPQRSWQEVFYAASR